MINQTPVTSPATLPWGEQFDMTSALTGRTYRIFVWRPPSPPPESGFPVIYVLDGAAPFVTASAQAAQGAQWDGRPPALVVGIGYPDESERSVQRQYDFVPSRPSSASKAIGGAWIDKATGEADSFHAFLIRELRPLVAAFGGDPANQTLMGFSLGGLFTLHVLFNHTDSFRTYVASSPSIWFNDREVLRGEAGFVDAVRAGRTAPRVLLTVGAWEEDPEAPNVPAAGAEREARLANMRAVRMVENARELAQRLAEVSAASDYEPAFVLFERETHLSVMPASTSRGVSFALARQG